MLQRLLFLLVVSICSFHYCIGQITFQKTYGYSGYDRPWAGKQTSDGGYVMLGSTESLAAGDADIYLIKTNASGDTLWTKTYGTSQEELGFALQQTFDGGYVIGGTLEDDFYIIRTNSNGDTIWTKAISPVIDSGRVQKVFSIQQTADSGFIIAGYGADYSFLSNEIRSWLIKLDAGGNVHWAKSYHLMSQNKPYSVISTTDGGFVIAGLVVVTPSVNSDAFLFKTDTGGNIIWAKIYGGTGREYASSVVPTTDGGYVFTGFVESFGAGNMDVLLAKTDSTGTLLWTKAFGGNSFDEGNCVSLTGDGGYIVTGQTSSFGRPIDVYLIKTNANGDTTWTRTIGGTDDDYGVATQQTTDGGFIISGYTQSFGAGSNDVYLVKTNANGHSECNEHNTATRVTTSTLQQAIVVPMDSFEQVVEGHPPVIIGNGGIGKGGAVNTSCVSTHLSETPTGSFGIWPNPSTGNFTLTFSNTVNAGSVAIFNVHGARVLIENFAGASSVNFTLTHLPAGIYTVQVFDKEIYSCKKIIITSHD